jgi:hypothetical protein
MASGGFLKNFGGGEFSNFFWGGNFPPEVPRINTGHRLATLIAHGLALRHSTTFLPRSSETKGEMVNEKTKKLN